MKGIILAGGTGSRLHPLTKITNKALLPVGREPMILRVLEILLRGGIDDVMLVSGPEHLGSLTQFLGSGKSYDCQMTYRVQDSSNGIAAALSMCENFVSDERFAVILGDNIFEHADETTNGIEAFERSDHDYGLFVKKVPDPQRFGVVRYPSATDSRTSIVEKPKDPPSEDAVLGLYLYTPQVFDIVRKLKPSARGEYEISDVNNELVQTKKGELHRINGGWVDAGTFESLERANDMVRGRYT